jgi:DNA polymerase-1
MQVFESGVYLFDFEFRPLQGVEGNPPDPVCLVVREYRSGTCHRFWADDLRRMKTAPFPCGGDALWVSYFSTAEMDCFLALGWPLPANLLDLFCEFRCLHNGLQPPHGWGLLGALLAMGLPAHESAYKEERRFLILQGGPWCKATRKSILDYCQTDVDALNSLLSAMHCKIDLPRALLRGRYMQAVSRMQATGIPIDVPTFNLISSRWELLQDALIADINQHYGVYDRRTFKRDRFADYLQRQGIPWPRLPSGDLDLKDDTFRDMARGYPEIQALRELRTSLASTRLFGLTVGSDRRNRCLLSPFKSTTGRNQPSNTRFVFGPAVWLRSLIKPEQGWGLAYIDYSQQEFGVAAALSEDPAMMEAYRSGDPYLTFAKQAGAVPESATKTSHKKERELFKACVLAVQYGMGARSLADKIGKSVAEAQYLLGMHRKTYKRFWAWSDGVLDEANLRHRLWTVFGWELRVGSGANPRSLRNFPMQANGAEILRLACIYLTEAGIRVCAPVHDAVLIEAPIDELEAATAHAQTLMVRASSEVLGGFDLSCDTKLIRAPERYSDDRGLQMWESILRLLGQTNPRQAA